MKKKTKKSSKTLTTYNNKWIDENEQPSEFTPGSNHKEGSRRIITNRGTNSLNALHYVPVIKGIT